MNITFEKTAFFTAIFQGTTVTRFVKMLIISFSVLPTINAFAESPLEVINIEVMLAPPGVSVTAGLMTLKNSSNKDIIIEKIVAEYFDYVEFHKTEHIDDMARMIAQENLVVPAGGTLELANGGYHLMLYSPSRGLQQGDSVTLTLFTNIGEIELIAPVVRTPRKINSSVDAK